MRHAVLERGQDVRDVPVADHVGVERLGADLAIAELGELDREGVIQALKTHKHVIVIEENVPQGGLAPQTKQIAWDIKASCKLDTFTLKDSFIHNYGRYEDLLASHGLSVPQILEGIR